jgi:hypothetical protein
LAVANLESVLCCVSITAPTRASRSASCCGESASTAALSEPILFHVDLPGELPPAPGQRDLVTGGGQLVLGLLLVRLGKFEVGCGLGIGGLGCRKLPLGGGQGRLGAGDLGLGFLQGQVCRGQAGLGVVQVFTQLAQRRVDRPFLGIGIVGTGHRRHGDREKQSGDHSDTAEARGRAHPAYRLGAEEA